MKKSIELRNLIIGKSEGRTIEGTIPYNSPSEPLPFIETIARGAFTKTLRESKNIRALYGHDENSILASTRNGSLVFEDREDGLHFSFELPNTRLGEDVGEMVRTGLVDGCSFGMIVTKDEWSPMHDKRTIKELRLFEVSLCPQNQAYQGSSCSLRSLSEVFKDKELTIEDTEQIKQEIEQLSNLLPKEEEKTEDIHEQQKADEPDPQTEQPKEEPVEEKKEESTTSDSDVEPTTPSKEEQYVEELLKRLDAVEKLLNESEASL